MLFIFVVSKASKTKAAGRNEVVVMVRSRVAVASSAILGKALSITGYSVGLLSVIVVIMALTEPEADGAYESLVSFSVVAVLCVVLIVAGAKIKRRILRFKQYVALLSLQNITSLDALAASTSRPVDFVIKDLRKMIRKRFFPNAAIDFAAKKIIVHSGTPPAPEQTRSAVPHEDEAFRCSSCGATGKKEKGLLGHCDYCGSPIR